MDPPAAVDIGGDGSFALGLEAQKRGLELYTYHPRDLFVEESEVFCLAQKTFFRDEVGNHVDLAAPTREKLDGFDFILMRQDPPFNMEYITATYFLDLVKDRVKVINNPTAVRTHPEKILPLLFKDLMPKTLISTSLAEIERFRHTLRGGMILKPLYGNGGEGVVLVEKDNKNLVTLVEKMLPAYDGTPIIAQDFVERVVEGDKRIILLEGEAVAALNRVPAAGEVRANLGAGASAHLCSLTSADKKICEALAPVLRTAGILFAGIDVIDGLLTEVNITSPTGIRQIKALGGVDIAQLFWDRLLV